MSANTDVNVSVCGASPVPPPQINEPTDGSTYDTSVLMRGTAAPNEQVYAYRNGVQVGFVFAGPDGQFGISVSLDMGNNVLSASTNNVCGAPAFSDTVTVERKAPPPPVIPSSPGDTDPDNGPTADEIPGSDSAAQPPTTPSGSAGSDPSAGSGTEQPTTPVITDPARDVEVSESFLIVSGTAAPGTKVTIWRNDDRLAEVTSDARGRFRAGITLQQGSNRLMVTTGSGDSLRQSKVVVVTYHPKDQPSERWSVGRRLAFGLTASLGIGLLLYLAIEHSSFGGGIRHLLRPRGRK